MRVRGPNNDERVVQTGPKLLRYASEITKVDPTMLGVVASVCTYLKEFSFPDYVPLDEL